MSEDKKIEDIEGTKKWRDLDKIPLIFKNILLVMITILCASWSIDLHHVVGLPIFKEQFLALIFAIAMSAIFLGLKPSKKITSNKVPLYDWMLAFLCLICGLFVVINYRDIVETIGELRTERIILGYVAVILVFEATRRATGWALVIMGAIFIGYSALSHLAPGILNVPSTSVNRIATYLYLDNNALLGTPLDVTTSIIVAFILFGRVLFSANGDKFLNDFALTTMGSYRGGPAKVAVVASSLFGTISGSAVSNVVMDGPITIPMMRRSGYKGHVAAAIEAVASTGGQIMPPVMGIVAFLMVDILQVSYGEVIIAAAIPALMYYLALFIQIDLEAAKNGLSGVDTSSAPPVRDILARGWVFIIPIFLLIWTLVAEGWAPGRSAMLAVGATIAVSILNKATRPSLKKLWLAIIDTGQTVLELVIITALAGMIIGSIQISTLGFNFSLVLTQFAGDNVLVLVLMTALLCIVLGMGMPSGVIYLMLALLIAPALVEMGIQKMAAHLFIFYFGMLSMITPPICIATFAACAVANTDFWKTGLAGVRLGIAAYFVPLVFVFQPEILFEGTPAAIIAVTLKTALGVSILAIGMAGYFRRKLSLFSQFLISLSGVAIMLTPFDHSLGWIILITFLIITLILFFKDKFVTR